MDINKLDIVESKAYEFIDHNLDSSNSTEELISDLETQLYKFTREKDKLKYLTVVSQYIQEEAAKHAKECKNPTNCGKSKTHREATFFVNQMLEEYGIGVNNIEVFTSEERIENNRKLDELLEEIQ